MLDLNDSGPLAPRYPVAVRIHGRAYSLGETISPGLAAAWQRTAERAAREWDAQEGAHRSRRLEPCEVEIIANETKRAALEECARPVLSANT